MKKEIITTDKAPKPSGSYSQAVKLGDMVYVAGTCPFDIATGEVLCPDDMARQTRVVLEYMQEILKAAGTSLEHVVKVTSFIDELDDFRTYDSVYGTFFKEEPPVRSTVEIGKFPPGMRVEIECIAYIPS
ncbi:reactive intermediate/imine deaminase [Paenibacillus baekrokdamisoli]|uniref:Reactive intermediate/imine deaminase n=1 Tax=Paenibacillus baekrokdamisoli TaxID=1712516 RepID=A0A3G9J0A4_9BACL|nr:Rid family detoxifying hydrolase [Paenibacillus baekrokdamisoli]MBB3071364.1 2-iminobutanoate/2-iminopropanoate deaminase [Paenibacillus baekrokdamisoli]BBH24600.1 reactive intermediate/imine deaminase [Paenibacillus baekrokdamisoli]